MERSHLHPAQYPAGGRRLKDRTSETFPHTRPWPRTGGSVFCASVSPLGGSGSHSHSPRPNRTGCPVPPHSSPPAFLPACEKKMHLRGHHVERQRVPQCLGPRWYADCSAPPARGVRRRPAMILLEELAEVDLCGALARVHSADCSVGPTPGTSRRDRILFREGEACPFVYLVLRGSVTLEMTVSSRGTVPVQTVGPGDPAQWTPLLRLGPMTATARTLTRCRLARARRRPAAAPGGARACALEQQLRRTSTGRGPPVDRRTPGPCGPAAFDTMTLQGRGPHETAIPQRPSHRWEASGQRRPGAVRWLPTERGRVRQPRPESITPCTPG